MGNQCGACFNSENEKLKGNKHKTDRPSKRESRRHHRDPKELVNHQESESISHDLMTLQTLENSEKIQIKPRKNDIVLSPIADTITNAEQYTKAICKQAPFPVSVEYQATWQYKGPDGKHVQVPIEVVKQLESMIL
jgi:hypothetical protein